MADETPAAGAGHNSLPEVRLASVVERVESLEEEKAKVADEIKAVYAEAKADGFDPGMIRKVVAARKKGTERWREERAMEDMYLSALGLL